MYTYINIHIYIYIDIYFAIYIYIFCMYFSTFHVVAKVGGFLNPSKGIGSQPFSQKPMFFTGAHPGVNSPGWVTVEKQWFPT